MAWKNVDRKRAAHLAWARRTFNVALMRQFLQFDRHWSDVTNTTDMTQYFDLSPTPIAEAFNAVYVRVGEAFAKETFNGLKSHHGYQIKDIEFSPFEEFIRAWVATYAGERIVGITLTTQAMIQKLLQRAIDEGLGIAKAQALIRSEFTAMSRLRAERIARTEIVSASNLGSIEAARSTGLTLQKNWLSTRDARTREAHASVDGQVAELEGYFIVGGEELAYPGDINGSADNVINCRCTVTYTEIGEKSHHGYQIKDIEFSPFEEFIRAWVATYGAKRIDDMTKTTQSMLAKLVQQAIDEGMGVAKAQALIRSKFTDMSRIRAERIARTEIVSASNLGSIEAARSTGLNLQKNWLSTRDGRTREAHASVDGQPADLNGYFIVDGEELMYPGDIGGSPANVINCRCTVTYTEI